MALVATFSKDALGVVVGVMVLLSVLLTARAVVIPVNRATLVTAGFTSGVTGTATSIGGPPLAILLQHRTPRQIRTTLAVYFLLGARSRLTGLLVGGHLDLGVVLLALLLTPLPGPRAAAGPGAPRRRAAAPGAGRRCSWSCGLSAGALLVRSLL